MARPSEFITDLRQIGDIYQEISRRLGNIAALENEIEQAASSRQVTIARLHRQNKEDLKRARFLEANCAEQVVKLLTVNG